MKPNDDDADERPRKRRPGRRRHNVETLSLWVEMRGAHECDRLCDAVQDGLIEVRRVRMGRTRRWRLVLTPLLPWPARDLNPTTDRLRFCPFCGAGIRLVDAPARLDLRSRARTPKCPDHLPEDL